MIEINLRNHRDLRNDDIRRVQPAAQTHFEHHHIQTLLGKVRKRDRGDTFEKRGMRRQLARSEQLFNDVAQASKNGSEISVGNL